MKDPVCGMAVTKSNAFTVTFAGVTEYFCGKRCAERFAAERKLDPAASIQAPTAQSTLASFLNNKAVIVSIILIFILALSYFVPALVRFRTSFLMYFHAIWWAILAGFLLGGVIDYYVPREYISELLRGGRKRSILYAVVSGFLMTACSHGILALSIQLHKKGASNPSVISFLLASPWANIPLTIMLFGFFGAKALFIIFAALIVAINTGYIFQWLESNKWIESNPNTIETADGFSIVKDIKNRFAAAKFSPSQLKRDLAGIWHGSVALFEMIFWWILFGTILASLIAAYVPEGWFIRYMGPSTAGLFVTLAFAAVLEVCSEGTAPLTFEIFRQTGGFGNALVFLLAGVATDYTEVGLIWQNVGKRAAIWLPVIAVPQIILFGILGNVLF